MATSTSPSGNSSLPGDEPPVTDAPFADDEERLPTRAIVEWVVVVAGAVLVSLVLKTFVVQAFFIPSESMEPTLLVNDRVLVSKVSYRMHDVRRSDIVVFEQHPVVEGGTEIKDLIKRVIGLPGERLFFEDGNVFVNDQQLAEPYLPPGTETKPAPREHAWEHDGHHDQCTRGEPCEVPSETVWVMGDNRTKSQDSRYIGPVPVSDIVGRSFVIIWPPSRIGGL
jgi:signal peptidase I